MNRFSSISLSAKACALASLVSVSAFANSPVNQAPPEPTAEESVRRAIDNICGDTWCEGDFQFKFLAVTFDKDQLQTDLSFIMYPYGEEENLLEADGSGAPVLHCQIEGFADANLILTPNGSLVDPFYTSLSDCIGSHETTILKRLP